MDCCGLGWTHGMSEAIELQSRGNQHRSDEIDGFSAVIHQPQISYSTIAVEEVKRLAIRHYNFASSLQCVLYQRGINDVYQIALPDRTFALRISRANWRARSALMSELAVINHVHSKGVDVAIPIPRVDGQWITEIVAPEGLRSSVVYNWAKGSKIKYASEVDVRRFGMLMARVHGALDDMAPQPELPNFDANFMLRMSLDVIRPLIAGRPALLSELTDLASRLESRLLSARKSLRDWGLCHGDVANHNAHVYGDRCVLFDFDFCGWGWRLFDLACYRLHARLEGFEPQAWNPFIQEYLAIRADAEDSLKHIGLFMCLRHIWIAGKSVEYSADQGIGVLPDTYVETVIRVCKEIEAEYPR